MMNAYYSYNALEGFDDNCTQYIESVTASANTATAAGVTDLKMAIIKGMKEDAGACAKELLKDTPALDVINDYIIPALDVVGDGFEKNKVFLPQLLMSAAPDTATALPKQARYQLRYTRLYIVGLSDRPHSIPYSAPVFKSFLHRQPQKV